jgi:uncharacterized protein YbcI
MQGGLVSDIVAGRAGASGREGPLLEEISRRIVQLYKESHGRGPTRARTYWEDDVITVVVRGGFTPDERTLRAAGRGEAVLEHRVQFQEAMRARFRQEVEHLTGRTVIGVMSGVQVEEPEMAAQVFVLEPDTEAAAG